MLHINVLPKWLASRERRQVCSTIVMHATAGSSLSGALSTLIRRGISYHYIIDKDGHITKCVATSQVAYHAGRSIGPEGSGVNNYSIGISYVNRNDGVDPYPLAQKEASKELVRTLTDADNNVRYLTTHRQVSWPRKNDPVAIADYLHTIAGDCGLEYWTRKGVPE